MLEPSGTPSDGDVPIYQAGLRRTVWGSFQSQIDALQAQIDALGGGSGGIPDPGGLTPSYSNRGGWGNRSTFITGTVNRSGVFLTDPYPASFTWMTDGVVDYNQNRWTDQVDATGIKLTFDFPSPVLITEARWFCAINSSAHSYGTWQWEVSNDRLNWTAIGSSFVLDDANLVSTPVGNPNAGQTSYLLTQLSSNTQLWKHYRMRCLSGSWAHTVFPDYNNSPTEIQFKIAGLD